MVGVVMRLFGLFIWSFVVDGYRHEHGLLFREQFGPFLGRGITGSAGLHARSGHVQVVRQGRV
jgi:hypothetical protein